MEQLKRKPLRILAFGDSLTAGWNLPASQAFPAVLETKLRADGWNVTVINAGVSGDTTAMGLARLPWLMQERVDAVILELGANDGLRGESVRVMEENLAAMLTIFQEKGLPVLFAGMYSMPNLGEEYSREYDAAFPRLAHRFGVVYYPFFLEGVALDPALNFPDGLHPNAAGVRVIVERIYPKVLELLLRIKI